MAPVRLLAVTLAAQSCLLLAQSDAVPRFDAASVKPQAGEWVYEFRLTHGSIWWRGADMNRLIRFAYDLPKPYQVVGPSWMEAGSAGLHYDVNAKAGGTASEPPMRFMMRSLLAERFNLIVHRESKVVPALVLTLGKGPLKLREPTTDGPSRLVTDGPGLQCSHASMAELAAEITDFVPEFVVDETGLKGRYDFAVDFMAYTDFQTGVPFDQQDFAHGFARALEQLGLRLDPARHSAEIIVVDHVEKTPSEN